MTVPICRGLLVGPDRLRRLRARAGEALLGPTAIAHDALIEKPFAVESLTRRVREALEEKIPAAAR